MDNNFPHSGVIAEHFTGIGAVSRAMVHQRARELSVIAGRVPPQVSQADYEQAKRELTGETELDLQEARLESLPESDRWNPVPGSAGHQAPEAPAEDDADAEGQNESAQLVTQGVHEAEHDQMLQAARAARTSVPHET
jgi:hypothetical protein